MILKAVSTTEDHLTMFDHKDVGIDVKKSLNFSLQHPDIRPMMSFFSENTLVFICGLSYISEGVWEAWLIPGTNIKNFSKATVRTMRDFTNWLLTDFDAHRLQIAVLDENVKWAEALGFQFESIVKNYHSRKDHFMYVKVRN
jgi:hypothetical protein